MSDIHGKQEVATRAEISHRVTPIWRLVCVALLASVLGMASVLIAGAPASAVTDQGFTYDELNGTAVVAGCEEECPGTLIIPSTLGSLPVSRIAPSAFV